MAKKKISRKQLLKEPDEFITVSGKLIRFAVEYRTQLISAVSLVFVLILVGSGIRYVSNRAEGKASGRLEENLSIYEKILNEKGPDHAYAGVEESFEQILKEFSRTSSAKIAGLMFANISYRAGHFEKATSLYQKALDDLKSYPLIEHLILSSLGYSQEKKEAYHAAIGYFEKISDAADSILKDEALFQLGRLYIEIGESEKSAHAFGRILSDHPSSMYVDLVREKNAG